MGNGASMPRFQVTKILAQRRRESMVFEASKIEHQFPDFLSFKLTATVARRFDVMSKSPRAVF